MSASRFNFVLRSAACSNAMGTLEATLFLVMRQSGQRINAVGKGYKEH